MIPYCWDTAILCHSLDPSLPARECNCDGRVRKRGGEKGLAHFILQLRNLTNQILLVGMRIVGFQVPVAEVYVNRLVLQALNFFGFQDVVA